MDYVVCDTTVVSDLRRGGVQCAAMSLLTTAVKVISVVTAAELRAGAIRSGWGERKRNELEATINAYVAVDVDDQIADVWARLKAECLQQGRNVGLNDLWIAATGVRLDCPVASLDQDFARIPGIQLLGPSGEIVKTT
jgi:tRNA(fMet)-specific endonuclease VapC